MKKGLFCSMVIVVCLLFSACGGGGEASVEKSEAGPVAVDEQKLNTKFTKMTAEEIINLYKDANYPISKIIVYDEENDVNELLGRPNQYVGKINFADSRQEQFDIETDPVGGSIEVFSNKKDAETRKKYLEKITASTGMFNQYLYLGESVLLRIDGKLTPTQAKEYEDGFNAIIAGNKPMFTGIVEEKPEPKDSGDIGNYSVAIKECKLSKDDDGKDVLIINYDFTNNGNEAKSFGIELLTKAFQDGISLEIDYAMYDNPDYDPNGGSKDIKDGATIQVQEAFILENTTSPVEIEVSDPFDLSSSPNFIKRIFTINQ